MLNDRIIFFGSLPSSILLDYVSYNVAYLVKRTNNNGPVYDFEKLNVNFFGIIVLLFQLETER